MINIVPIFYETTDLRRITMNESLTTYLSFYAALVAIVRPAIVAVILLGLWAALRRTKMDADAQKTTWFAVAIPLAGWLTAIWIVAASGALQARAGAVPLVLPIMIGLFALMRSERIAAAIDLASPGWLIGLQVYRVLGINFVILWGLGGAIPPVFALPAGLGDVLVGALALPVAFYVASGAAGGYVAGIAWNILGIVDLVQAVSLGFLSSPGPLHLMALDNPNLLATSYPTVMTPTFAVPLSIILHTLSIWQLHRQARQSTRPKLTLTS